ncbi:FtsX-like permease family protein [Alteromonas sediminis]|uniref:FtsX-like permease family protein n=1 Tax=Alteromonas sediminis TaxID=2259342 RepID=A0A3N5YKZ2_9ALTE|nr:lipocalin-like domain-containing protein [Alteromonas sediminis]RPJ65701.1 FtsX-like permease family protein [Alteromonas sediminis]
MKPYFVILQLFFLHAKKHWIYIALVFFALITAGAGLSSVLVINQAALSSLEPVTSGPSYAITSRSNQPITLDDYGELRKQGVIDSIAVTMQTLDKKGQLFRIWGIDIYPLLNSRFRNTIVDNSAPTAALPPIGFGSISKPAAALLNIKDGDSADLGAEINTPPLIVGDVPLPQLTANSPYAIALPLRDFFALFPQSDNQEVNAIYLLMPRSSDELSALTDMLPKHLSLQKVIQANDSVEMGKSFSFHLVAMGGLMVLVCLFIVTNALSMLLAYRHTTISHLHKLGITKKAITVGLITELGFYCLVGSLLGVLLGFWAITQFDTGITATLSNLLRSPFSIDSVSFISVALLCVLLCVIGVAIATFIPLKQALKTELVQTNNTLSWHTTALTALTTGIVGYLLFSFQTKLADLTAIGLVILAGCIVMTTLVPTCFRLFAHLVNKKNALLHWSLKSGEALSSRCKLAASAYFISLVCIIGLTGMVDSFRTATNDWLSKRLVAPAYVYTDQPENVPVDDSVNLIYRRIKPALLNQTPINLSDYPLTPQYREGLTFHKSATEPWKRFETGEALFINQQFAYRNNVYVGDSVELVIENLTHTLSVMGIYYDYGNPNGNGLVAPQLLAGTGKLDNVVAVMSDTGKWQDYQHLLVSVLPNASFLTKSGLLSLSMGIFDRTFILTDGLTVVALIISALSFAITIALLSRHLSGHIRILSALGIQFRVIQGAVFTQFALICLLVTLLAIPAGLVLSHVLISIVNVNAFGWTYPLNIKPSAIGFIALSGFIGMLVVCWLSLYRASARRLPSGFAGLFLLCAGLISGCSPAPKQTSIFANVSSPQSHYQYEHVDRLTGVKLPADHAPHPEYQLEWWYLTIVLRDETQRPYPFQYTLFRFNRQGEQTYMAHASLHTPEEHFFEERFAEPTMPYLQVNSSPFSLQLDNWLWQGQTASPFPANLSVDFWQGPELDIEIANNGPVVTHGDQGISTKSANGAHVSYYYSYPFLSAKAKAIINGETKTLKGNAWYDHEWTSQLVDETVLGWDWFSLHLDSGDKIMVFRLRIENKPDFYTGTYISASGQAEKLAQNVFSLSPTKNDDVPLDWVLSIPEKSVSVQITPFKRSQWNCGTFVYYEGGVNVQGSHSGEGFMELTGYGKPEHQC